MAKGRHYDEADLLVYVHEWSEDSVTLGEVDVPRTSRARLVHPDWPAEAMLHVTVTPDDGPVATGLMVIDQAVPFHRLADAIARTTSMDELLRNVAAEAAGRRVIVGVMAQWFDHYDSHPPTREMAYGHTLDAVKAGHAEGDRAREVTAPRRQRRLVNEALLREVAEIYRKAIAASTPPTVAVAEHFGVPHSTASRWVGAARKAGTLGAATGTRAGEES